MREQETLDAQFVDHLSSYMQQKEEIFPPFPELSEEIYQAALEADRLLQVSSEFQSAFSSLLEKIDHAKR